MTEAEAQIKAANQRLKQALFPVTIRQRGNKLSLRATLPPKPNSSRVQPSQQAIALGLPANTIGIQQAEIEAVRIGTQLITGNFSWKPYLSRGGNREPLHSLIKRFEVFHRSKNKISDYTWKQHYLYYYYRLPQGEPLSVAAIMPLILAKKEHTRARQQICRQWQKLCDFAELKVNLLEYQGRYNSSTSVFREVPLDEEILEGYHRMRSPQWRWVYGMMATYGLRDHECWLCEFNADGDLQVLDGKTGPRLIQLPLYEQWVDEWDLRSVVRPQLDIDADRYYLAAQCSQAFRRAEVGFPPYTLRYAYGHRGTVSFGYEVPIMSVQMGHSPAVHRRTYQRFINAALVTKKVAEMKARSNLPMPPS
ncbi:hypothetical protein [cf. Phormidesmis sp. LEGE 11477]|uniref:hypothetical protein n=1 Tax=cf. Phormidesmis sp. LEGE 11477 TaxID=1828680 RepID=UPI0018816E8C|nr:hypothetical protein [cf. Phormidesmis sp. LEGE 11477]MBE9063965.1 hypothetical protein [cf. Phormidesmis sp. LEGE 11477]